MDLRALFQTDKRAESDGKKLFLNADKTVWLLVARRGNPNYKSRLTKLLQENSTVLNAKGPDAEEIATRCFKDAAAHGILIGWSPTGIDLGASPEVTDATGKVVKDAQPARTDIPYSVANAMELFEMDDFYEMVNTFAGDMSQYRAEEVTKDAKNSQST